MVGKYRVNEIAGILGVSQTTVYKHFARTKESLKTHYHKEKGILLFDEVALNLFRELISTADKDAIPTTVATRQDDTRLAAIEKVLSLLVDENRRLAGEVATLRAEIAPARPALPIPVEPSRQVKAWSPDPRPDPAASLPWWRVAWLSLVAPEQLRRCDT